MEYDIVVRYEPQVGLGVRVSLPCARLVGDEGFLEESGLKDKDRSFYFFYYPQCYLLYSFIQYHCSMLQHLFNK